jgi:hypothetical protein
MAHPETGVLLCVVVAVAGCAVLLSLPMLRHAAGATWGHTHHEGCACSPGAAPQHSAVCVLPSRGRPTGPSIVLGPPMKCHDAVQLLGLASSEYVHARPSGSACPAHNAHMQPCLSSPVKQAG